MNMTLIPARTTKFIGVGVLSMSLLAAATGCAAGGAKDGAPAAPASAASTPSATPSAEAKKILETQFVRAIDGDTIEVQPVTKGQPNGEPNIKVHMLGVNAPEATACGGAESIANLERLFRPSEFVHVTYEPTLSEGVDKDGNTLAYVITGAGVTQDIGNRMVREGFATASYPEGETAPKRFKNYEEMGQIAVDQKLGIWASCPAPKV
jgi:endonuclease YncB( thermonuclease family)